MPGRADRNLRSGNMNEDLGILMLSSFCAVAPVPRQQDVGVDVICTLLRPDGARQLYAEESFYVQVKSASVDSIDFIGSEYDWLKRLDLPYFVARVDARSGVLELFTSAMCKIHFVEKIPDYAGVSMSLSPNPTPIDREGMRLVSCGTPIIRMHISDVADRTKLDLFYAILKLVVRIDAENRRLIRVRTMKQLVWQTNSVPRENGQMTLINVGAEQYEREAIDALMEIVRGSLMAFIGSPEGVAAIMPLLEHAQARDRLTDEDRKTIGFVLHIFKMRQERGAKKDAVTDGDGKERE